MPDITEVKDIDGALELLRKLMEQTDYGEVGILVKMQAGKPVFISPNWQPVIKVNQEK